MNSLKISDYFETNHHHNCYSISHKAMPSGNLDSSGHTQSNNSSKKLKKTIATFNVLQVYLE